MKKSFIKPFILLVMVAVLITLVVIPTNLRAKDINLIPGIPVSVNEMRACFCPSQQTICSCLPPQPVD